jgi:glycosyltransferase involved in cell wall biosynthesis
MIRNIVSPLRWALTTQREVGRNDWRAPRRARMGVNLIGPVEFLNGVAISARGYVASLLRAGIPLNVIPWERGFERLQRVPFNAPERALQPISLVHLNLDLLTALLRTPARAKLLSPRRYNVPIVYWELTSIPAEHAAVLEHFDEVWCASSFTARALAAATSRPVRVVRPALEPRISARSEGSRLERKNPLAFLQAYLAEFAEREGACCVIKIIYADRSDPRIRPIFAAAESRADVVFIDRLLDAEEMADLFSQIDCYVSPHRSEGLGLSVIEAMRAGKPVIATPYGGVTDFVTERTAFRLAYELVAVGEGNEPYPPDAVWADPRVDSLRSAMRTVMEDRQRAVRIAASGQALVAQMFGLERTAEQIATQLLRIWARGGGRG